MATIKSWRLSVLRVLDSAVTVTLLIGLFFATTAWCGLAQVKPSAEALKVYSALKATATTYEGVLGQKIKVENASLSINLDPIPYHFLTSRPDKYTPALEVLIRTQIVKKDLMAQLPNEAFWSKPIDRLEKIPLELVSAVCLAGSEDETQQRSLVSLDEAQKQFAVIDEGLVAYASKPRLSVERPRGALQGFAIKLEVGPPAARVRYMTVGEYDYSRDMKQDLTNRWTVLSDHAILIGRYHYIVDWPSPLEPQEGVFEVQTAGQQLSFPAPKQNGK